jgi:hypothetical protein
MWYFTQGFNSLEMLSIHPLVGVGSASIIAPITISDLVVKL